MISNNKNSMSVNSVMRLVTIMVLGVVFAFYLIVGLFVYIVTEKENNHLNTRIENAFQIEYKQNINVAKEYSYWDETYKYLFLEKNKEWIIQNMEKYLFKTYDYDWIGIKTEDGIQLSTKRRTSSITVEDLKNIKINDIEHFKINGIKTYQKINDSLYEITIVPFVNGVTKTELKEQLIFAVKIDNLYLNKIINKYELPYLKLGFDEKTKNKIELKNYNNEVYGYIYWDYSSPIQTLIPYMIGLGIILLIVFIILIRKILFNELEENAKYEETLFLAATKDHLTNIANRGSFIEQAKYQFNVLKAENRDGGILILDIDYFKKLNDNYGHYIGDRALIQFAKVCKKVLRHDDLIGRIGGEEFAIFLPNANEEICMNIANRIHDALLKNPVYTDKGFVHMTVSIGCALNTKKVHRLEDLINNADTALYESKNNGRNRTSIFNYVK